eukprot:GDKJ01008581.1.p1 GENE.GDKJ01008581.1~~GDKJ01008581.1.p1  ORF type:complete len:248 (+),score=4.52 GDKJ01008581.1:44-745(+)
MTFGDGSTVPTNNGNAGRRTGKEFVAASDSSVLGRNEIELKEVNDPLSGEQQNEAGSRQFDVQANNAKQVLQKGNEGKYVRNDVKDDHEELLAFKFGTFSPIVDYRRYLHGNFYVSFNSLFVPTAIGESTSAISADVKFLLAHIISAILLCYPAALCVERRRFVLDFIVSLYLIYIGVACIVTRTAFQPFTFWLGCVVSSGISFVGTAQIVYKREMAEVLIPNDEEPSQTVGT